MHGSQWRLQLKKTLLSLLFLLANRYAEAGTIVFSTDFTNVTGSGTFLGAGTFTQSSPGNNFLQNTSSGRPAAATRLVLNNLPAHSDLDLSFTFWAIDSWDGTTNTCCGTDIFKIKLNGLMIYSGAFRNWGILPARLDGESLPGAAALVLGNNTNLTGNSAYSDSIWTISLTNLSHNASSATIEFFADGTGWDGGMDESFGLDNITVQVTDTPEPASLILSCMALAAMGLVGRRRIR